MKHGMIVNTVKKDWKTCNKTGRHLNLHNPSIQDSCYCLGEEVLKVKAVLKAIEFAKEFKDNNKKTTAKTMDVVIAIYSHLFSNPSRMLQIDSNVKINNENLITKAGLKKVLNKMEELKHIIIFQGYAFTESNSKHNKAIPMCIESLVKL